MATFSSRRVRQSIAAAMCAATIVAGGVLNSGVVHADVWHGRWIRGAIEQTYNRLGGWNRFGDALIDESVCGRGGRFQTFERNASIYWHPDVDRGVAHEIEGLIRDRWGQLGWENGPLGYPTTDEGITIDREGRFNHFENGAIFWHPRTGAHAVQGLIRDKWAADNWERGQLGYPTTDELTPPDGVGRFNHFEHGSIYWHPSFGAHIVPKAIEAHWESMGWETGRLGYPIADAVTTDAGLTQKFEHGAITIRPQLSRVAVSYNEYELTSWRQVYPVVGVAAYPQWSPEGLAGFTVANFGVISKMRDFGKSTLKEGQTYSVRTRDGSKGVVKVVSVGSDGFVLETQPGHPEGSNRRLTIRFEQKVADVNQPDVQLDSSTSVFYAGSKDQWLQMVVESDGPVADALVPGVFNDADSAGSFFGDLRSKLQVALIAGTNFYFAS